MKAPIPIFAMLACMACIGRRADMPPPREGTAAREAHGEPGIADAARHEEVAVDAVNTHPSGLPGEAAAPAVLAQRLDLTLIEGKPVRVPALRVTVTVLSDLRLFSRSGRHSNRTVMRFERDGEAPFEVVFKQGQFVHPLFGHHFAVFSPPDLSIFPPGHPVHP